MLPWLLAALVLLFALAVAHAAKARKRLARAEDELASFALMSRIIAAALESDDLGKTVQVLADLMASVIRADGCFISFWDSGRQRTVPMAAYGPFRDEYPKLVIDPAEQSFTKSIVEAGRTLVIRDSRDTPLLSPSIAGRFPFVSMLGIPMRSGGRVIGAIMLSFDSPHGFTETEIARCERVAGLASYAIGKSVAIEDERARTRELAALNRIGLVLASGRGIEKVVASIFEQCREVIDLDVFYLGLYEEDEDRVVFPVFYDSGEFVPFQTVDLSATPGVTRHLIETRKPLLVRDTFAEDEALPFKAVHRGGAPARCYLGVPMLRGDRVLGVISAQSLRPNAYGERELQLLQTIAAQSALALDNAKLYEELSRLSATDALTGVFNYRSLVQFAPMEFAKARRLSRPLSLAFFDIDDFRAFNSRFGHETGNRVLVAVTDTVKACLRGMDFFARYGGEEFVVVLGESSRDEAAAAAERLRAAVEALRVESDGRRLSVTISVGVASMTDGMEDFRELLEAANAAERRAKEAGKNRVVAAE